MTHSIPPRGQPSASATIARPHSFNQPLFLQQHTLGSTHTYQALCEGASDPAPPCPQGKVRGVPSRTIGYLFHSFRLRVCETGRRDPQKLSASTADGVPGGTTSQLLRGRSWSGRPGRSRLPADSGPTVVLAPSWAAPPCPLLPTRGAPRKARPSQASPAPTPHALDSGSPCLPIGRRVT